MSPTRIMPYRRWRNKLVKKGLSGIGPIGDESFHYPMTRKTTLLIQKSESEKTIFERMPMAPLSAHFQDPNMSRLIRELSELCEKEKVFRAEKVAEIKRKIQSGTYHVSGRAVVEKWFGDDSESRYR